METEIEGCDDSDADSTFSSGDQVDDSDNQTHEDAPRGPSEGAKRTIFWKTSSR